MDLSHPLIINTEVFLQCHGSCAGCFLTSSERLEENTYLDNVEKPLLELLKKSNNEASHYVIGFGRGNLLSMSLNAKNKLLNLMKKCEEIIPIEKITYEVSTSLIGKIDKQIDEALLLLDSNKKIYFNIVINSEITSKQFWQNWHSFYEATEHKRKSWGLSDNWGDILVLNINPKALPSLDLLSQAIENKYSPFNISLFPFSEEIIEEQDLLNLKVWTKKVWEWFKDKDLNIKNYLYGLYGIDTNREVIDMLEYHEKTKKVYYFIDKKGHVVSGSTSIMGEVDYVRLQKKYNINPDIKNALIKMQRNKACSSCDYQFECIASGAYLNMISNQSKINNSNICLSGYQSLFNEAKSSFSQIAS